MADSLADLKRREERAAARLLRTRADGVPIRPTKLKTPCMEAQGTRTKNGYVVVWEAGRCTTAHRLAYCKAKGLRLDDLKGMDVCHDCDNPPCINLEHLFLGTRKENMEDMVQKGRASHLGPIVVRPSIGERSSFAKLDEATVRAILAAEGSGAEIARRFHVSEANVSRIRRRLIWRHLI